MSSTVTMPLASRKIPPMIAAVTVPELASATATIAACTKLIIRWNAIHAFIHPAAQLMRARATPWARIGSVIGAGCIPSEVKPATAGAAAAVAVAFWLSRRFGVPPPDRM